MFQTTTPHQTCYALPLLYALAALALMPNAYAKRPVPKHSAPKSSAKPTGDSAATQEARRAIQTAYDEQNAAFARLDLDGYLSHHATDFVSVDKEGKETGDDETRQMLGMMFQGTKSAQATTTIQQITLQSDGAVVVTRGHVTMTIERPGDRQVGHLVSDGTYRDFWVKADSGWRCKRSKALSEKQTINGQPAEDAR